jgi:hypothetical protein
MSVIDFETGGTGATVPPVRWRAPDTLLENLQLIADGVVAMAGFAVAAIRIRRGEELELVVDTGLPEEIGTSIGQDGLQWLFLAVFGAMLALVPAFGWIVQTLARRHVLPAIYGFFIVNLLMFWAVFSASPERPGLLAGSLFFVWASVYNLFIVSLF